MDAQKKAQYPVIRFNNANLGRNFPLIRLADVLLMYAEAANELGMHDEARDALNQVRQRRRGILSTPKKGFS